MVMKMGTLQFNNLYLKINGMEAIAKEILRNSNNEFETWNEIIYTTKTGVVRFKFQGVEYVLENKEEFLSIYKKLQGELIDLQLDLLIEDISKDEYEAKVAEILS